LINMCVCDLQAIWQSLLNLRIREQRAVNIANRLPQVLQHSHGLLQNCTDIRLALTMYTLLRSVRSHD
jgi:hypothetical protein